VQPEVVRLLITEPVKVAQELKGLWRLASESSFLRLPVFHSGFNPLTFVSHCILLIAAYNRRNKPGTSRPLLAARRAGYSGAIMLHWLVGRCSRVSEHYTKAWLYRRGYEFS
jgi:hypothetical protein